MDAGPRNGVALSVVYGAASALAKIFGVESGLLISSRVPVHGVQVPGKWHSSYARDTVWLSRSGQ